MLGKLLSTYLTVFESSSEKFTGKRLLQNNNTIPLVINWKHNNHIMACVFEIPLSCKSVFINFKVFFLRFSHVDTSTELAYFANVINLLLQYGGRTQHHTRVSKQTKGVHYSINRQGIGDKYPKETVVVFVVLFFFQTNIWSVRLFARSHSQSSRLSITLGVNIWRQSGPF